jgi:hypothetical protein
VRSGRLGWRIGGCLVLLVAVIGLTGCGNSLQSRANDLAQCLQRHGMQATANSHGNEGISVNGNSRQIDYAEVHVEPDMGKGPPRYNVQVYKSADDGRTWILGLNKSGRAREALLVDGGRALMFGLGVREQQPLVQDCLNSG